MFWPINPGDVVNCEPDCAMSPTGSTAYLRALLDVEVAGRPLGDALALRAGPFGDLAATAANAEIAVPVIDLVNESLEAMVANGTSAGVVHDTDPAGVPELGAGVVRRGAGVLLARRAGRAAGRVRDPGRRLLGAGTALRPAAGRQPLEHLEAMGTTRFDVLRGFRRDITEFVLERAGEPAAFPRHVWRYPVRLDLALEYLCVSPAEYTTLFGETPAEREPRRAVRLPR
nr:hypothetical protein GCM10020092_073800 [Actinoplanes digitatis]